MNPREAGRDHRLPQSVLAEFAQIRGKISKMSLEERASLLPNDPLSMLGFNDVRSTNLLTVPDRIDIKLRREELETKAYRLLTSPLEDVRQTALITLIMLDDIEFQSLVICSLSRSKDLEDRDDARRIIKIYQKDSKEGYLQMQKKMAELRERSGK